MLTLPEYPWDAMVPYRERARRHPDGVVDLSIGTPVDPTPPVVREALAAAADAPGYPTTHGRRELREAVSGWFARRRGVAGLDPEAVMPTIGSKELVAWLPTLLGLGVGDVVLRPQVAYPTYDIGAQIAGAEAVAAEDPAALDEETLARVKLIWVNSPSNPTGEVKTAEQLRAIVELARRIGAVVASDECYAELPWTVDEVPSILDPRVCGGDHRGLLAVYSASKQSNLAGYRAAFVAGCGELIAGLINTRKHAGMIMPAPVQEALRVALTDDEHVAAQRDIYRRRREKLLSAVQARGLQVTGSQAGLYLWCSDGSSDTWGIVSSLADEGLVVGPGVFYGDHGAGHVRVALTAADERVDAAVERLG
ncbi:succinyldiaminopimelate transaminase [Nesterenkonia sp. F]|uniref:succinyldiaminopimelate transaminase n=1 Tax=Nesterenkonia sp. F TaxID=795955 RepID=UPI000255D220|nr:succinyldiaminopimelate transaminase [Nesterenkonia sp. F]